MVRELYPLAEYAGSLQEAGLLERSVITDDIAEKRIRHISFDSNDMVFGTLFICKGAHFSPIYLADALEHGAIAYVSETSFEADGIEAPHLLVSDIRKAMPLIADMFYGKAWQKICMVGITGTKGKSSTAYYMKYIIDDFLKDQKKPECAVISGIDNYDGVSREESHLTTPEAMTLHRHIDNAVNSGIEYLVMEVSSQALKYDRTKGIIYDVAAFMNIGQDHISPIEHPSLEDYVASKMILMKQCRTACINLDSDYARMAIEAAKSSVHTQKIITFGQDGGADITGSGIEPDKRGITFRAECDSFDEEFRIEMTGLFNVENALAAIAMSYALNIPVVNIKAGLKKARVSGRMEIFSTDSGDLTVIVDYAHNKMSFEALLDSTWKEYPDSFIYMIFGCPGKKALGRRKELGEAAGRYADMVYLTEEDAGEEPVHEISSEIAGYVDEQGCDYEIIDDRGEAIRKAILEAPKNTVILLTGKGRETRQKRGTDYIDTPSDVEFVEKYLRERQNRTEKKEEK